jgi:hypothetical protein
MPQIVLHFVWPVGLRRIYRKYPVIDTIKKIKYVIRESFFLLGKIQRGIIIKVLGFLYKVDAILV